MHAWAVGAGERTGPPNKNGVANERRAGHGACEFNAPAGFPLAADLHRWAASRMSGIATKIIFRIIGTLVGLLGTALLCLLPFLILKEENVWPAVIALPLAIQREPGASAGRSPFSFVVT